MRPKLELTQSWQMYKKGAVIEPDAMTRSFLLSTGRAKKYVEPAPVVEPTAPVVDTTEAVEQAPPAVEESTMVKAVREYENNALRYGKRGKRNA